MEITVKVSGLIAKQLGFTAKTLTLPEGTDLKGLLSVLDIRTNTSWLLLAVNSYKATPAKVLKEGDHVIIMPVCGGG